MRARSPSRGCRGGALLLLSLVVVVAAAAQPPRAGALPGPAAGDDDLCEILDLVLRIGCTPPPPAAEPAGDQLGEEPVRRSSTATRYDPRRLALSVKRSASARALKALFGRAHVRPERTIPQIGAYMLRVAPQDRQEALAELRHSPLVARAQREVLADLLQVTPNDAWWPQQWGLRLAGFPDAWQTTRGSSKIIVAVIDTGVDPTQPDLRGALLPGYNFVGSNTDTRDDHGHGTAVAGIIAARANNSAGIAGICWSCWILPIKVVDPHGFADDSVIAAAVVWAVEHGARIINLSLGGPGTTQDLGDALAYAAQKGVAVIAAAGNSGTREPFYPAADPSVISVAATTQTDSRYAWSNFGAWIHVAAPGCNAAAGRGGRDEIFCGTSSATPVVAGLVALELSANPGASRAQIQRALEDAVVATPGVVQYGRIDAATTLSLIAAATEARAGSSTAVLRGRIDAHTRARAFPLTVGAGRLTASVRFSGTRALSLSLVSTDSRVGPLRGRSPLRLVATVKAGNLELVVGGAKRASFVLTITYVKAP